MARVDLHLDFDLDRPISLPDVLTGLERNIIVQALKEAGGRPTYAARMLGIGRQNLYMKMARLELLLPKEHRK